MARGMARIFKLMQEKPHYEAQSLARAAKTQLLTPKQAAQFLMVSERTVHRFVRERKLQCVQLSPKVRKFTQAQLDEFIASRSLPLPPKRIDKELTPGLPSPRKGGVKSSGGFERAQALKELRSWR